MAQNVTIAGASYSNVPAIKIPKTGGGGNALFVDTSGDTVDASHLAQGYTAHDAAGNPITGTMSGGGGGLPDPITAGDTPAAGNLTVSNEITGQSMVSTGLSVAIKKAGTYRFKWLLYVQTATSGNSAKSRLYKNGSAVGTQKTATTGGMHSYSQDIACNAGDTVTLYAQPARQLTSYAITCAGLLACIDWDNGL